MNPIQITLKRLEVNAKQLRVDIRCKWAPNSIQGEHFITTRNWTRDGSPLRVRFRVDENLLVIIPIPSKVGTQELVNLFVTPNITRTMRKYKNQRLKHLLDCVDQNLGRFNQALHINILKAFVDLYDN